MALILCPECGQQVSEKANECPNCGCPTAVNRNNVVNNDTKSFKFEEEKSSPINFTSEEVNNPQYLYEKALSFEKQGKVDIALAYLLKGTELNNLDCIAQLGYYYLEGIGVQKNPQKAVSYLAKAANEGQMYAQYNLGICYSNGLGVEVNSELADNWIQKAANKGHSRAKEFIRNKNSKLGIEIIIWFTCATICLLLFMVTNAFSNVKASSFFAKCIGLCFCYLPVRILFKFFTQKK